MDISALLSDTLSSAGAVAWGFVDVEKLLPYRPSEQRMGERFDALAGTYDTALIAAFPLYAGGEDSHIALSARAAVDYTHMGKTRLTQAFEALKPVLGADGRVSGNGYPLPVVAAARLAGVGLTGRNGLCIVPPYGSYVSLSSLVYSLPDAIRAALPRRPPAGFCTACGVDPSVQARCHTACPTGALRWTDKPGGGSRQIDLTRCCSHLNQKKGALTAEEEQLINRAPYVWGCDLCQRACPYNDNPEQTTLPELLHNRVSFVTQEGLEAGAYDARPFVRLGKETVLRNLRLRNGR